jgi:hypothetical protein
MEVRRRLLSDDCLTRRLSLLMLSTNCSFRWACPNRWYDVVGTDGIRDLCEANPQPVVLYGCQGRSIESLCFSLVKGKAYC